MSGHDHDVGDAGQTPRRAAPPTSAEAAHAEAAAGLRQLLTRPVAEPQVTDFLRAARLQQAQELERARRPRWPWLLLPAAAVAVALLLLLRSAPPVAPEAAPLALRLTESRDVEILPRPGAGERLVANARITSGEAGTATLRDPATAVVSLAARTQVRVARWTRREAVLEVEQGELRARVEPRTDGECFEVRTPYVVVRVVGTDFVVQHLPGEASLVRGITGKVRVETRDGRPLGTVGAGQSLRIERPQVSPGVEARSAAAVLEPAAPELRAPGRATSSAPAAAARPAPPDAVAPAGAAKTGPLAPVRPTATAAAPAPPRPGPSPSPAAVRWPPRNAPPVGAPAPAALPPAPAVASGGPPAGEAGVAAPPPLPPLPPPAPAGVAAAPEARSPLPAAVPALRPEQEQARHLRQLLAEGRETEVLAELQGRSAKSWQLEALRGDALLLAGRPAEAQEAYVQALGAAGEPTPERLLLDLAELLERRAVGGQAPAAPLWRRYLAAYPTGRAAPRALWLLAGVALQAGRPAEAQQRLTLLLTGFPDSPEADAALVRQGRLLLDARQWAPAAELFAAHTSARSAARAEAALVGLVRARLGQGRLDEARTLLRSYKERFPRGARAQEARHLAGALEER